TQVPSDFFYVGNASVKRKFLDRAGRFNESFAHHAGDDFEFGRRLCLAGMKATYVPEAVAQHIDPLKLAERERSMWEAGRATKLMESLHGDQKLSKTRTSSAIHCWLRIIAARLRLAIERNDAALTTWWDRRLDAAFAEGYRQAYQRNGFTK